MHARDFETGLRREKSNQKNLKLQFLSIKIFESMIANAYIQYLTRVLQLWSHCTNSLQLIYPLQLLSHGLTYCKNLSRNLLVRGKGGVIKNLLKPN